MSEINNPNFAETGLGFKIPGFFNVEGLKETLREYRPRTDDVFIVTYPKCGTTYLQQIVYLILHQGEPPIDAKSYFESCPFIEMNGLRSLLELPRPNAIKCHLPFYSVPYSNLSKYIYMVRNPKDCVVSAYHHTKEILGFNYSHGQFDHFFELFVKNEIDFGSYFEHVLSWYEHRNDPNVLFLYYEQATADPKKAVLDIAKFLGCDYGTNEKLLDQIVRYSSFDFMKDTINGFYEESRRQKITRVRKGQTGGWRSVLSEEQSQRIDQLIALKFANTDITDMWIKYDCI